jgi:hypothetical protein
MNVDTGMHPRQYPKKCPFLQTHPSNKGRLEWKHYRRMYLWPEAVLFVYRIPKSVSRSTRIASESFRVK